MNCTYTVDTRLSYLCIQMKFLTDNFSQSFVVVVVVVAAVVETFFSCEENKKKKTKNGQNLKRTRTNKVSRGKYIFQRSNICQE